MIPKKVRIELGLKTKMLVVRRGDMVVMKKLNLEEERRELEAIFGEVDRRIAKYGEMTGEEIDRVIHDYRSKVADKGK